MGQTAETYYENENLYGGYQYVSLKTILDGLLLEVESDEDHYLKNINRSLLIRYAKDAIREVNKQAANDVLAFSITVPLSLTWPLPQDFVRYVRISVNVLDKETGSYRLYPLDINRNMNMAPDYLQDDQGDLLFDGDGNILSADGINVIGKPYKRYKFCQNIDSYKLSQWGEFNFDRRIMSFSSDLAEKDVVIEYISDGLQADLSDSDITVHKDLRKTIEDYIYYLGIRRKRNVSQDEKESARRTYRTTLHQAKMVMADFNFRQIAKAVRGGNVLP